MLTGYKLKIKIKEKKMFRTRLETKALFVPCRKSLRNFSSSIISFMGTNCCNLISGNFSQQYIYEYIEGVTLESVLSAVQYRMH